MTAGIGTRSAIVDGVYTGELDGPFCYGAGKVEAIEEIARWEGLDLGQCYAYSDSASDLPMLAAVGHPVAVNPDAKLERHARRHGWPIVHFSQRTRAVIRRAAPGWPPRASPRPGSPAACATPAPPSADAASHLHPASSLAMSDEVRGCAAHRSSPRTRCCVATRTRYIVEHISYRMNWPVTEQAPQPAHRSDMHTITTTRGDRG